MGRMIEQRPINNISKKDETWTDIKFTILTSELENYVFGIAQNAPYIMIEKRQIN